MLSCVFVFMLLGRNAITHTSAMCPFVVWKRTWSVDCLWFYSQTTVWNSGKRLNAFCGFCTCIQDRSRDFQGVNQWRPLLHEYNVALQYGNLVFMVTFFCWKKGPVFNIASSFKFSENFHQNLSKITKKMFSFFLSSFKAYSTMEEHTCLIRENTSNLLLNNSSPEPFQVDKGQASFSKMTTLGAGNMALATPATVSEEDHTTTKRKTRDLRTETPEEQVC